MKESKRVNDSVIQEREQLFSAHINRMKPLLPKFYWHVDCYGEVHIDEESMYDELRRAILKANEKIKELNYDR
tara:strand:- start:14851 stop:15069 length:219 start_codon:yes stop_codon:yes gene_type:complete